MEPEEHKGGEQCEICESHHNLITYNKSIRSQLKEILARPDITEDHKKKAIDLLNANNLMYTKLQNTFKIHD